MRIAIPIPTIYALPWSKQGMYSIHLSADVLFTTSYLKIKDPASHTIFAPQWLRSQVMLVTQSKIESLSPKKCALFNKKDFNVSHPITVK